MRYFLLALLPLSVALAACALNTTAPAPPPAPPTSSAAASAGSALHALFAQVWSETGGERMGSHEKSADYKTLWGDPARVTHNIYLPLDAAQAKTTLAALHKIDPNRLSPSDQLSYRIFQFNLQDAIAANAFPDQAQALISQLWGPQLAGNRIQSRPFHSAKDYERLIHRLKALGPYLTAFTGQLKAAIAKGITQPRVVMERVVGEIKANIAEQPTESPFYVPFKHMPDSIPAVEQAKLREEAQTTIADVVTPAYKKFLDFFNDVYMPNARREIGVMNLPEGKAFYKFLVRHYTTTDMGPEAVHTLGAKLVKQIRAQMQAVFDEIGFKGSYRDFVHTLRTDPKFYYSDPDTLLMAYRAAAKRVDPHLTEILGLWLLPRQPYGVEVIPASLAPNTYPAYANVPYVSVNLYKPETRPKYSIQVLICHEGRPGHNLQIPVTAQLENLPKFRRYAYYNAFGEGWALYAETLCDKPMGLYDDPYSKFGYLNYQMWRAVRLVVDTGIHYYGWSRDEAVHYMRENTALANQNIATEVDRYIVWPGQALSYMIGERTILALRKEAQEKLGDKYSLKDFDNVVLGEGSLPMAVLQDVVHRWIERTLAGLPADQLPYADKPRSLGSAMPEPTSESSAPAEGADMSSGTTAKADAKHPATFKIARANLVNPTTLTLYYGAGAPMCDGELGKIEVEQAAYSVSVTLHRVWPPGSDQPHMCPHYRMLKHVDVKLETPLGKRAVVDGSTGKTIELAKGSLPPTQ